MRVLCDNHNVSDMNTSNDDSSRKLTANVKAGGCAAKIGSAELKRALNLLPKQQCPELIAGLNNFEDAAVYKITEDIAIVETIDFFPPVVDDPFLYGRIAAANALSDIYAMGAKPILALNVLCFPTCDYPEDVVGDILRGGANACAEAGVVIAGGHSIQSSEPIYGLAVTGIVNPKKVLTNGGAQNGDILVTTKPLGTGVMLLGAKGESISEDERKHLFSSMTALNKKALDIAIKYQLHAATDITGFGLVGHLTEMSLASNLSANLYIDALIFFAGALELAAQGFVPAGAYGNRKTFANAIANLDDIEEALQDLLFDPQTSGGLMFAVAEHDAEKLLHDLQEGGLEAAMIGQFKNGRAGEIEVKK
jgi:selenide, water dikinase